MTVKQLAETLGLEVLSMGDEPDREITGGYVGDLLSWVMGRAKSGDCWMTIMSNVNVAAVAELADVACVILAENVLPDEPLKAKFDTIAAAVFRSPMGSHELAWRVHEAAGV